MYNENIGWLSHMGMVLVYLLGLSNLMLALLTFVLLARPDKMLGVLAHLNGLSEEWRLGRLLRADHQRLLLLSERLRFPALLLLFGWSFFCGAMMRFLYL